jgi:hypothetical protein
MLANQFFKNFMQILSPRVGEERNYKTLLDLKLNNVYL